MKIMWWFFWVLVHFYFIAFSLTIFFQCLCLKNWESFQKKAKLWNNRRYSARKSGNWEKLLQAIFVISNLLLKCKIRFQCTQAMTYSNLRRLKLIPLKLRIGLCIWIVLYLVIWNHILFLNYLATELSKNNVWPDNFKMRHTLFLVIRNLLLLLNSRL